MLKYEWYQKAKQELDLFKGGDESAIEFLDTWDNANRVLETLLPLPIKSLELTFSKDVSEVYITIEIGIVSICYNIDAEHVDFERIN